MGNRGLLFLFTEGVMKLLICAFPGTGKSTISKNAEKYGLKKANIRFDEREGVVYDILREPENTPVVFDSDGSLFDKLNFPDNYIKHIQEVLEWEDGAIVLGSSHDEVRERLREAEVPYTLVFPKRELKGEYLERYRKKGRAPEFISMMETRWNDFIDSCEEDPTPNKIVLGEDEFIGENYLIKTLIKN